MLKNISNSYFINLSSRKDRLYHFNYNIGFNVNRFNAIKANPQTIINGDVTIPEHACYSSHLKLWQQLSNSQTDYSYLILEDDVYPLINFIKLWNNDLHKYVPEDFDLIYLGGCLPANKIHYRKILQKYNPYFYTVKDNNFFEPNTNRWHMTTESYIISKSCASYFCEETNSTDINVPVDHFISNQSMKLKYYHVLPECFVQNKNLKSDIN